MSHARQQCHWHVLADPDALAAAATRRILAAAETAIARHKAFHLVLAGGGTPRRIYQALSQAAADWRHWHIYFGDERCLPPDDPERNSRMVSDAWLDHVAIPAGQIHPIPAELGPIAAAAAYVDVLGKLAEFDLVLLGLGEDGHTASLFPAQAWGIEADAPAVLPVFGAPKPPPERVSLSAHRLATAREVLFLVSGLGKLPAVTAWRQGAAIPAAAIAPATGVEVMLDFSLPQS